MMVLPMMSSVTMVVVKPETARPWVHPHRASAATANPNTSVKMPRKVTIRSGALVKAMVAVRASSTSFQRVHLPSPAARDSTSKWIFMCLNPTQSARPR